MVESSKRVLVVDDERSIVRLVQSILEPRGYKVEAAYDGEEAMEKATAGNFILIILDLMMPRMHGLEVLQKLKSAEATKSVPVAILTTQTKELTEMGENGLRPDWYVRKPFDTSDILALVGE
jgi:DNA-binding response OmpR family regulator